MAKKEINEQLKSYEGYINDIPLVIDPCKQCKNVEVKCPKCGFILRKKSKEETK